MRDRRRFERLATGARVAGVATLVITLVYVAVAAALDLFLARRVLWEVDQRLTERLAVVGSLPAPLTYRSVPDDVGTDGAPVFVWWISAAGRVTPLTVGSPPLPAGARHGTATPVSLGTGATTFRYETSAYRQGHLVAAQDLAAPSHIERVLLLGELVIGPALLVAVFSGVLVIGVRASAPVEAARRRILELTADASHELRTPLTVIEAEIELARTGPPDPAADREALDHVARESRRLKAIVEDLLWLARFDSAPPPPVSEPVDLVEVARTGVARFVAVAGARGIVLDHRLAAGPLLIDATPEWVERLLGTLLDNACRYAPSGGRVRVTAAGGNGRAVLRVEDDGPGIPPATRATLFDRFRRATDQPGGAGLGLAIADSVVRSSAGRWRVADSALGGALLEVSWRSRGAATRADGPVPRSRASAAPRAPSRPGRTG